MSGRSATCCGSNWLGRSTIISGQKPARRKRRHAGANRRKVAFAALRFFGVVALVALAVLLPGYIASRIQSGFRSLVVSGGTKVEFLGSDGPLADFDRESLQTKAVEALRSGKSLQEIARIAGAVAPLSRVSVVRTSPDRVVIGFERREPALRIERGTQKLIDSAGFIYGSCCILPAQESEAQLPLLSGIPNAQSDNGTSPREEQNLIHAALSLNSGLMRRNIAVSSIRYQGHRGFFAVMNPEGIEVAMGNAPFDDKLSRLSEVLERVDRQRVSRIELDYHGKAFIKERKL